MQPEYRKNEMLAFLRGGLEDISISRETLHWGIPFPIAENGETAEREDGSWDPEAGVIYVWFDALINYITGAGFPDDPEAFAKWWPADLHVIGKDINRFHTIIWPAMLMSAGIALPRKVWVHGWLLAAGGDRMSKSRGNMLDPTDVVAALGADGARYVTLREVAFDRDTEVSWDSFVRRYNADLANDFGNLVNRTVTMAGRYLGGERPAPRPAADAPLAAAWAGALSTYVAKLEALLLHDALAALWDFVGRGEPLRRGRAAVGARQGGEGRRRGGAGGRGASRGRAGRPRRGRPADLARGGTVHALDRRAGARAARPRLPVRGGREWRTGGPRRACLGRARRGSGPAWHRDAALPAPRI